MDESGQGRPVRAEMHSVMRRGPRSAPVSLALAFHAGAQLDESRADRARLSRLVRGNGRAMGMRSPSGSDGAIGSVPGTSGCPATASDAGGHERPTGQKARPIGDGLSVLFGLVRRSGDLAPSG